MAYGIAGSANQSLIILLLAQIKNYDQRRRAGIGKREGIKMTEEEALYKINNTTMLQSLLYDIGMMPEQLERGTREWTRMLAYAYAYQAGRDAVEELSKIK